MWYLIIITGFYLFSLAYLGFRSYQIFNAFQTEILALKAKLAQTQVALEVEQKGGEPYGRKKL